MTAARPLVAGLTCAVLCAAACHGARSVPPTQPAATAVPGNGVFNLQLTKAKMRADVMSDE